MQKRIAVIDRETCTPHACSHLCKRVCPINRKDENCILINSQDDKPNIEEPLCIGCGICVNKCPVKAISVINLPAELSERPVYKYGRNQFQLFRLPVPKEGMVVGIIGQNGIGKSTAVKILSGKLKPNLGILDRDIPLSEALELFKGSELQRYLTELDKGNVRDRKSVV